MSDHFTPPTSGAPGDPMSHQAPAATATRGRASSRKTMLIAGGAVAAVLVAGGGAFAAQRLTSSGAQPDEVLPGTAIAFVRVDLDPAMGQKLAAFRLMDKLPELKDSLGKGDPKKAIFEQLRKSGGTDDVDYDKDIAPWLGDRFAMALLPGSETGKLVPVTAFAIKDEAKAREGMDRLAAKGREKAKDLDSASKGKSPIVDEETVNVIRDGYVLTMPKSAEQKVVAAIDAGPLAKKTEYLNDMKALGDQGVASAWYDPVALQSALPSETAAANDALSAITKKGKPVASTLRFGSDYLEIVSNGAESGIIPAGSPAKDLTNLPTDTVAFASLAGAGDMVGAMWEPLMTAAKEAQPDLEESLTTIEEQTGLSLPEDLQTLLGKQLDVIVPKQDFANDQPFIGARVDTDTAKAESILTKVEELMATDRGATRIPRKVEGSKLYLAMDESRLGELTATGDLGSTALPVAVPQLQDARGAFYVDLDAFEKQYVESVSKDYREAVQALRAVGMSFAVKDGREISTMRLVVN